jgi:hypothetical protein
MDQSDPAPPGSRPETPGTPPARPPEQPEPEAEPAAAGLAAAAAGASASDASGAPGDAGGLDLLREAPHAAWSSNAGRLTFGGSRADPNGFAIHPRPRLLLEDDSRRSDLLETHPRWTDDGWIRGEFWVPRVGPGHHFLTEIGFIQPMGEPRTNGVTVLILFGDTVLHRGTKLYTGRLEGIDVDLSGLAGRAGLLTLEVGTNGDPTQDWLVWTNPRIAPKRAGSYPIGTQFLIRRGCGRR